MTNFLFRKINFFKGLSIIFVFIICQSVMAQPYRVAIVPFTINTEADTSNLKDGIYNILSSRLSKKDTVVVIDREETDKACEEFKNFYGNNQALMVGAKLQADYVVYGSVTVSGENISILLKLIDISGKKPAISFSKHIREIDGVIPQVNLFASELHEQDFTGKVETEKSGDTAQTQPVDTLSVTEADSLKDTTGTAVPKAVTADSTTGKSDQAVSSPVDSTCFSKKFWKSRTYPILIIGIAVGDVNNDGKVETIVLTDKMVQMYRGSEKKVIKLLDIQNIRNKYPIGVDVADINKNGIPEIFITSLDTYKNRVTSFILEYNGTEFKTITKNLSWYLRVIKLKDTTSVLLGQKHSKNAPYKGKIYQMKWEESKLVTDIQILPSRGVNVMGLAYGDLKNTGRNVIVAYDKTSNIRIINPSTGKKMWNNREVYGGSTLYYQLEGSASIDREYLPMRIIIKDINSDGKQEVIAVKNHEVTRNLLGKFRHYSKSYIEILTWDGIGLTPGEKTGEIGSYMRDFAIGDFDNDGRDEFVAAIVQKEGRSVFNKPQSSLVVYELNR